MDELVGPLKDVFSDIKQKWREMQEEPPLWDVIMGFVHAIDWKASGSTAETHMSAVRHAWPELTCQSMPVQERWIQVLVATEVLLLLTALLTRKRTTLQFFIFALAGES